MRDDRAPRDRAAARRARAGDVADRLGLLRRRAARGAARGARRASRCRCRATRRCGRRWARSPRTPGPTRRTCPARRSPRRPTRPAGWRHEPLRLIVRRVPFSAAEDRRRQPERPAAQDDPPDQLALALDGQVATVFGYSFILTDLPPTADRLGRALPPPPRPDRGAPQGRQARPSAAPPALRRHRRQPRLADACAAGAQPHRLVLRALPRRRRLRQGARRRAAALRRPDAAPDPLQRPRPDRPHRPAHDPAPARRLPPRRRLPGHPGRRLRAAATLTPRQRPPTSTPAATARARRPRKPARSTTTTPGRGPDAITPHHGQSPRRRSDRAPPQRHPVLLTEVGLTYISE